SVAGVSCGEDFVWAWGTDGTAFGWGDNRFAQLARPTTVESSDVPTTPPGFPQVSAIRAGATHACAVAKSDGSVRCWGDNYQGAVGTQPVGDSSSPVTVLGL